MKKAIPFIAVVLVIAVGGYLVVRNRNMPVGLLQEVGVEQIAQGLVSPVAFVSPNDGTGRMFSVDQIGLIDVIDSRGQVLNAHFLDVRDKLVTLAPAYDERGLLGLAFHPDFKENGRFFVYYSAPLREGAPSGWNHTSVLSEFNVSQTDPDIADPASEKVIMRIDEPQLNHNGGHIAFGPDGYLYVPLGDGGQANDVGLGHSAIGNGQDNSTLLGKILRVDIDHGSPYSVPADNPFVGKEGLDEIFAFGFRNPYHISFDSGKLFAADVGQNLWEEVDIVVKGENYGWNAREGTHCFDTANPDQSPVSCGVGAFLDPIIEYGHDTGKAIIGGYVYRGPTMKGLVGNYIFADWSSDFGQGDGGVFAAALENGKWSFRELKISNGQNGRLKLFIKGIGRDADNELYLLTTEAVGPSGTTGKIFKIIPTGSADQGREAATKEGQVSIKNFSFNPQTLTVQKGTTVTWTNEDSANHQIKSATFSSAVLGTGGAFSFAFDHVGSFDYYCAIHPSMTGNVIVQ